MKEPSTEDLEAFKKWEAEHPEDAISAEVIQGVIEDDVKEQEGSEKKRGTWNRDYNHAPAPTGPRIVGEQGEGDA